MANVTAATNYGDEPRNCCRTVLGEDITHYDDSAIITAAPFLLKPDFITPAMGSGPPILTKTHCEVGARTYPDFERGCRTVWMPTPISRISFDNSSARTTLQPQGIRLVYDENGAIRIGKIVHLVRSPFDNLVARKHLAVRRKIKQGVFSAEEEAEFGADTPSGFQAWCRHENNRTVRSNAAHQYPQHKTVTTSELWQGSSAVISEQLLALLDDHKIPCALDLLYYVTWHNFATQLSFATKTGRRHHVLHYEDYTNDYDTTVGQLLDFLDLRIIQSPAPFVPSKTYRDYYDEQQARSIESFVRELASPACWELLRRYF